MMKYRIHALALLGLALTGCGGGGGGSASAPPSAASDTGTLVLSLPSLGSRHAEPRDFITVDSTSFVITISSGGQTVIGPITVTSAELASDNNQVTIPNVPLGNDTIIVQTLTFFGTSATSLTDTVNVTAGTNALTVQASLSPSFSLSDLKGTYTINAVSSSSSVLGLVQQENRISGTLVLDGTGTVTSANVVEGGIVPVLQSGRGSYQLLDAATGAVQVTLNLTNEPVVLTGHLNSSKDIFTFTDTDDETQTQPVGGFLEGIGAMTLNLQPGEPAPVLSSNLGAADTLFISNAGTIAPEVLSVPSNTFAVSATGGVTGSLTSANPQLLPAQFLTIPDVDFLPGSIVSISAGEDFINGTIESAGAGAPGICDVVTLKASYTNADLNGTYGFEAFFGPSSQPPGNTTFDGTMTFDGKGHITTATLNQVPGTPVTLTGTGTYLFDNTGLLTATFTLSQVGSITMQGFLNPRDEAFVGTMNNGQVLNSAAVLMVH